MKRMTVSLKLDEDLWKKVRHLCIDANMEYSSFVEEALKDKISKKK
jgi:predicted transcriptional regulator